jgi:hypothetical protein
MKLVSSTTVINELALRDLKAIKDVIDSMLDTVTIYISAYIRTGMDEGAAADKFRLTLEALPIYRAGDFVNLHLSRGFVTAVTGIRVASSQADVAGATPLVEGVNYEVNKDEGQIVLMSGFNPNQYLTVEYDCGFTLKSGVAQGVPSYLSESAIRYVESLYAKWGQKDSTTTTKGKAQVVGKTPPSEVALLLGNRIRMNHNGLTAYHSTFTAA